MEFAFDARTEDLRESLFDFISSHVYPAEPVFHAQLSRLEDKWAWDSAPVIAQLRAGARRGGLWNLFVPGTHGAGLTTGQGSLTGDDGHSRACGHRP